MMIQVKSKVFLPEATWRDAKWPQERKSCGITLKQRELFNVCFSGALLVTHTE